jgi:hypothetical protein
MALSKAAKDNKKTHAHAPVQTKKKHQEQSKFDKIQDTTYEKLVMR